MGRRRPLAIDDLLGIEYLSCPVISVDGDVAYYVVSVAERSSGQIREAIWEAPLLPGSQGPTVEEPSSATTPQGGASPAGPHRILGGNGWAAKLPTPSPDGGLYYLADVGNPGTFQVWRRGRDGSRECLTSLRHGVTWFSLAPDGRSLCLEAPLWPDELGDAGALAHELSGDERASWEKARRRAPVVVEQLVYKLDDAHGLLDGSVACALVHDLGTGATRLLAGEGCPEGRPMPHLRPTMSPDATRVACWCEPHDGWGRLAAELSVIDLDCGRERVLTESSRAMAEVAPVWLDCGRIAYASYSDEEPLRGRVMEVPADGGADTGEAAASGPVPRELLDAGAPCWGPGALVTGHTAYGDPGSVLARDGDGLVMLSCERGCQGVWRLGQDGAVSRLTPERCCIHGFSASQTALVYVKGEPDHLADLYALDRATGRERRLAHHNAWADEVELPAPTELSVPSPSDGLPVHGWVLAPAGGPSCGRPGIVLDIHGGPECCYPFDWWFEFFYLASRGLAVCWCDPHGSTTYGPAFQEGAWDGRAQQDLLAFLDAAIEATGADPARSGVTGGSYGGYMTNVIIGTTDRFAAAVSQRNLCNRATSYGTGDMGSIYEDEPFPGVGESLLRRMRGRSSPVKMVDHMRLPLLVEHATADYRCGFEQGEQLYHAMLDRNPDVPVRLCAFPGENHGLTRDGNAWAQRGHLLEMADWFCRWLGGTDEQGTRNDAEAWGRKGGAQAGAVGRVSGAAGAQATDEEA